ncbi:iron complex transport system permease protein [Microbacterium saperdae]|uniref:Iron complex transport system permease protein n=2 Tax=Microbacterium saperdae TaxID=69368 RepID=A0A543BAP4_9MICO|nr:iron ABC transporter permease [Microbacterium saperdae]TQL81904.1 iron complex transport system permease protein [Microbacterium saperdae]
MTSPTLLTTTGRSSDTEAPAGGESVSNRRVMLGGFGLLLALIVAVAAVGLWHLTQGTSGVGAGDLLRALNGEEVSVGGVSVNDIFTGSRLPRLLAGVAVGFALGVAGALLQSVTRNMLASPDTLAVTAGAYFALTAVAAFGLSVPLWASSGVAFVGGLLAAALVLGLTGRAAGTSTTRLILAGSAIAMALDAGTAMLLILFKENTTGLFAWGSGSLGQLNIDASVRAAPMIVAVLLIALLLSRRLDVLGLGDDAASSLGVPVRSTRMVAVLCAVLLTSTAVTLAGPIAFVGLGAPVLARLLARRVPALRRHVFLVPTAGLLGALLILLADVALRAILGAEGATSIPTGIPTALLGGIVIVILALRMRDAGAARAIRTIHSTLRTRRRFLVVALVATALLLAAVVIALLAGSLWLRTGDILLWIQHSAPDLVARALDERAPRIAAAVLAGAALALAGVAVQGTVRNPLAEPGLLGITAGAGLGAVIVVTTGFGGGGRPALITMAIVAGLLTFGLIALLAWRGGLLPDRFVLVGIGCSYAISAVTAFLLLRSDPWETPRILTWLSGTTYGRSLPDVLPVAIVLLIAIPILLSMRRELDLLAIDEDTPRILGVPPERTRLGVLALAAVLAAVAVIAVGTVGFVGLVAPHLARTLVGARHGRVIPVAMVLGGLLVLVADTLGRTLIAPSQLPAGLMIALVGAPYFVWLLRRMRD